MSTHLPLHRPRALHTGREPCPLRKRRDQYSNSQPKFRRHAPSPMYQPVGIVSSSQSVQPDASTKKSDEGRQTPIRTTHHPDGIDETWPGIDHTRDLSLPGREDTPQRGHTHHTSSAEVGSPQRPEPKDSRSQNPGQGCHSSSQEERRCRRTSPRRGTGPRRLAR